MAKPEIIFPPLVTIEKAIGYDFKNKLLLVEAFTHRSFVNERYDFNVRHNERLEFLGDSVLGMLVAEFLYLHYPETPEGILSDLRSRLVEAPSCIVYIQKLKIASYLQLGKGERINEGKGRGSLQANLFEAIIGAIYLDGGLEAAKEFFFSHFESEINAILASPQRNYKAELQDYTQRRYQKIPVYEVLEESGPSHQRHFRVGVWIEGQLMGEGIGTSKKEAQANAARAAIEKLDIH